ncbi:MAG: glycosyltransferase family 4 protein [Syntrophorhabdaceae bacterium]|nr:glycosyltransferase family 4 protein [Syntrophorhabdaceae bacterium]
MARGRHTIQGLMPRGDIYFISTYPPRNCGIATFTSDLARATDNEIGEQNCRIVAMNNRPDGYDYPEEVCFEISQNQIHDYRLAAEYINFSNAAVVSLQHEFGIFGGEKGVYITHLLANLKKPVVTTLHTVLKEPEEGYKKVLQEIAKLSQKLVVMSHQAEGILTEVYGIPGDKIRFIHHGVPDVPFVDPNFYKDRFNVEGKFVLLTFGLINPNKGIETVIEALPEVVKRHPDVAYIVLGATHPEVKRVYGESYRLSLQRKVSALGLEDHVFFHNRFVTLEELCEFIGASDIYITPYLSKEQITSGTLAYAIGMGKAVISTPYWYAEEMLSEGRGRLVGFNDPKGIRDAILELIENEKERHQMRKKAYELGRKMTWKSVAREYLEVFREAMGTYERRPDSYAIKMRFVPQDPIPEINMGHIYRLTDDTGIIQHSSYCVPDRRYGYSTDDVARALVVVLMAYHQLKDEGLLKLANIYLAFLRHAQLENGKFHNFMDYTRRFIDDEGSEDTFGRAIWGLGYAVHYGPYDWFRTLAKELLERAMHDISLVHPMSKAYTIIGLYYFLKRYGGATTAKRHIHNLADTLIGAYLEYKKRGWPWFSDSVTYGNAKIPQALLFAYRISGDEEYKKIGLESLNFLTEATFNGEYFDFVGNDHWLEKKNGKAVYDQQPIEAGYAVEAYVLAYETTGNVWYLELAQAAFDWFLGKNRLGVSLYDFTTGACYDGLTPFGPNLNQGAESTIAFLLANLTMSQQQVLKSLFNNNKGLEGNTPRDLSVIR